jgi:hypothetical protein
MAVEVGPVPEVDVSRPAQRGEAQSDAAYNQARVAECGAHFPPAGQSRDPAASLEASVFYRLFHRAPSNMEIENPGTDIQVEQKILHMVTADRARTPTFTDFANPTPS